MDKFFSINRTLFCLLLIFACKPINIESPQVKEVSIVGDQLIVKGSNFVNIEGLALSTTGYNKTFQVTSVSESQIIGTAVDNKQIKVPSLLNLIIDSAQGQSTYPVSFSLQADSVTTGTIQNGAIIPTKLKGINSDPPATSVLSYNPATQNFFFTTPSGGGGSSGVSAITYGEGILGDGSTATGTVDISVNVGEKGSSSETFIPYFNSQNKIVMDSTNLSGNLSGLQFKHNSGHFNVFNNGALRIRSNTGDELLVLDYNGNLTVDSSPVCTQATGCSGTPGSGVNSVTTSAPLIASGTTNVVISAGAVNTANNLVQLTATGSLPNTITGVVRGPGTTSSGTVAYFSDSTGDKVGDSGIDYQNIPTMAVSASGTYQPILSGGSDKTLITAPYTIPFTACSNGEILVADGSGNLNCGSNGVGTPTAGDYTASQITNVPFLPPVGDISAFNVQDALNELSIEKLALIGGTMTGTIITSSQIALELRPSSGNTGEIRFVESTASGTDYVGFKAPNDISTNVIWTLPSVDGASGTVLTTNGNKTLTWTTVSTGGGGTGDVAGPATSSTNTLAQFSDETGKIIKGTAWTVPNPIGSMGQYLSVGGSQDLVWTSLSPSLVHRGGTSDVSNKIPKFDGSAGTTIIDSGIDYHDIPTMAATATEANYPILSVGASKQLVAAPYKMPATTGSLGQVLTVTSTGTDWVTNNNGDVTGPGSLTTVGNLVVFNGISGTQISDSLIASAEIPTMAAAATGTYQPILSAGANRKQLSASYSIPLGVCPNGQILKSDGSNYLCGSDVGGGDVSSSGTFRANVPALFSSTTGKIIIDGESALMDFDETGAAPAYKEARVFYDSATKALAYYSSSTGLPIEIGQQMVFLARNNTAGNFPKGSAVYVTGAFGGGPNARPTINLAIANSPTTSRVIGITAQAIGPGADGYVTNFGLVRDVNTSGFSEGQILYLSDTASGTFTTIAPALPVVAGRVIYGNTANGIIGVAPVVGAGNVFGPANSVDGRPAIFSGPSGKQLVSTAPFTLPTDDGSNGQVLTTNGTGATSWTTIAGSGDVLGPVTNSSGTLALWDGVNTKTLKQTLYTFPTVDGTDGQILRTNGAGVVTWENPPAKAALEYPYEFDSATGTGPASGDVRINNSSNPSSATFIYISEEDDSSPAVNRTSRFLLLKAGDLVDISSSADGNDDYLYQVNATPTDFGTYIQIPVVSQTISGSIANNQNVIVALVFRTATTVPAVVFEASDLRVKKAIRPFESSLNNILKLNTIRYKWKYENDQSDQVGLNALEVQKLFPDLIATVPPPPNSNIDEEILGINYSKMVIPLIKAFQEKSKSDEKTIQMLTERIERLEKIVSEKAKR